MQLTGSLSHPFLVLCACRALRCVQGRKHGWYRVIQSLVRVLPDGPNVKRVVDRVIDQCAAQHASCTHCAD